MVSYCPIASAIGSRVLYQGGNAVDAAVATALTLAVTYPQAGNLGGGGFLLVCGPRQNALDFLDYRETAPRGLTAELLVRNESSIKGGLAVGVPGTVAGLSEALLRYGTWAWDRIASLAVDVAEQGNWLTIRQAAYLRLHNETLRQFPSTRRYFTSGGEPPLPGTLFSQPDLGQTLRLLAEDGPQAFYRGKIAEQIAREIAGAGGVLDLEDLASYAPKWRRPLQRSVFGRTLYTAPLPSAGGLVVQLALGLFEAGEVHRLPPDSADRIELTARCFRVAFALRAQLAGDPDRMTAHRHRQLEAMVAGKMVAGDLERLEQTIGEAPRAASGGADTTHFCVLDSQGMAVSNTYSLNTMFGAKLAVGGAGFILNNCIDDFSISRSATNWYSIGYEEHNQVAPGARPVSSMAPTILTQGDRVELVIGGSGGPRIPTLIAQTILRVLGDGLFIGEAMRAPRIHHQFSPDELVVERGCPPAMVQELTRRGFVLDHQPMLGIGAAIHQPPGSDVLAASLDSRFSLE